MEPLAIVKELGFPIAACLGIFYLYRKDRLQSEKVMADLVRSTQAQADANRAEMREIIKELVAVVQHVEQAITHMTVTLRKED